MSHWPDQLFHSRAEAFPTSQLVISVPSPSPSLPRCRGPHGRSVVQEGKRGVSGECTVFYMPHCGTALYNNLLWSNWTPDALSSMLIIGNSFAGLQDR